MDISPYARKVQYYENDPMGIVHHSNYIRWFEEARVDFMDQIGFGYQKVADAGVDFPLLSLSCEYKSMVRFGDTVNISVEVALLDSLKMTLSYKVTDAKTGKLRAIGESKHCYYHAQKMRPVFLDRELPALYAIFKRHCKA